MLNNLMNNQFSKFALAAFFTVILFCGRTEISAQTRPSPGKAKAVQKHPLKPSSPPTAEKTAKPVQSLQTAPVSIVNVIEPEFLSGEPSVTVNPKQPTVIRLGLAQNAVSIVEFPASDGIYYIHEGNPKLASVFQSPTKETDRSITVYPGESFLPNREGSTAAAISLQMRSGLVLILEFVPVTDLRKNAHRCVITYDREAVIAARRSAGLAYDLGGEGGPGAPVNSRAVSKLVGSPPPNAAIGPTEKSSDSDRVIQAAYTNLGGLRNIREKKLSERKTEAEISTLANKKLADSVRDPKKNLGDWSKPQHGLELAVSRISELDMDTRLVVVAIRNITAANLRLVPSSPELQVQTADAGGNSLQTARLESQDIESTTLEGLVQPGSTVYYALVYKAPILGTNQNVRVMIAHREAADAPLTTSLSDLKTKE